MRRSAIFPSFLLLLPFTASAQWDDIKQLGEGGETFVSTDGKGNVYATSHIPCKLYVSNDYGKTFGTIHDLPEGFCDVTSTIGPDGKLYVVYLIPGPKGVQVMVSSDKGKTIAKGGRIEGPYDREWIVVNPVTNEVGFDYSDGFIGGPKSKGVFYASSNDGARTFRTIARIDKEPEGSYPVDPYLAVGTGGRIYAAWACSYDYNKIDKYMFASSDDGGKTWKNHTTIGTTHPNLGDTQERWMLGSLVAVGKDTVMAIYQDYVTLDVDGEEERPLLTFYRVSNDGGKTWSQSQTCTPKTELEAAIRAFRNTRAESSTVPNYAQTLPWASADPKGRIHMAFEDNRSGQKNVGDKRVGLWHVRYAMWTADKGFGVSERVSHDWPCWRPPMDFIGCCSDGDNVWITWTENPNKVEGWDFSGHFFIGKKTIPSKSVLARAERNFPDTPENHKYFVALAKLKMYGILPIAADYFSRGPRFNTRREFAVNTTEAVHQLATYLVEEPPLVVLSSPEFWEDARTHRDYLKRELPQDLQALAMEFSYELAAIGTSRHAIEARIELNGPALWASANRYEAALQAAGAPPRFPDVDIYHWAYGPVQGLRDAGILAGYPEGTFNRKTVR